MKPGDATTAKGVGIEAVAAYNITQGRLQVSPGSRGDNGYVLTAGGRRLYIAGDTEDVPEARALKGIDIAFLPMNLPYTMTPSRWRTWRRRSGPKCSTRTTTARPIPRSSWPCWATTRTSRCGCGRCSRGSDRVVNFCIPAALGCPLRERRRQPTCLGTPDRVRRLAEGLARRGSGTILISRLHPTAFAYFLSVLTDGECLPTASRRETALLVVPIDVATSSCVRPACARAARSSRTSRYSSFQIIVGFAESLSPEGPLEKRVMVVGDRTVFALQPSRTSLIRFRAISRSRAGWSSSSCRTHEGSRPAAPPQSSKAPARCPPVRGGAARRALRPSRGSCGILRSGPNSIRARPAVRSPPGYRPATTRPRRVRAG